MAAMNRDASMETMEAQYLDALALHQAGDGAAALHAYDALLAVDPWHGGALIHASALALALGREDMAQRCYQELFNLPDEDIVAAPELAGALPEACETWP